MHVRAAVIASEPGGPEVLIRRLRSPIRSPGEGEVVIHIAAAGVNRPDTAQRQGVIRRRPASDILGLECAGVASAVGAGVERWRAGDEVCALVISGGYAYKVSGAPKAMSCPCHRT